jgi:hypothetical protein
VAAAAAAASTPATPASPASSATSAAESVAPEAKVRDLPPPRSVDPPRGDEALDLGATVLPVLARAYWKQALGAVLGLLVLRRLLGRLSGRQQGRG